MRQVWKCDFCRDLSVNSEIMEKHEKECRWNPKNKKCQTCKFQKTGWEFHTECVNPGVTSLDYFDIGDDNLQCNKWERNIE